MFEWRVFKLWNLFIPSIEQCQVAELLFASAHNLLTNGTRSIHRIVISLMSTAIQIYPITAIVLCNIICYVSAEIFDSIHNELNSVNESINTKTVQTIHHSRLKMLARRYLLGCDTVDAINCCFGWTLLSSSCFIFVALINQSFNVFAVIEQITLVAVSFLLFNVITLILVCFPAHRIQSKVVASIYFFKFK